RPPRWDAHWSEVLGSLLILCILIGGVWAYWEAANWTPESELRRLAAGEKERSKGDGPGKPPKTEAPTKKKRHRVPGPPHGRTSEGDGAIPSYSGKKMNSACVFFLSLSYPEALSFPRARPPRPPPPLWAGPLPGPPPPPPTAANE